MNRGCSAGAVLLAVTTFAACGGKEQTPAPSPPPAATTGPKAPAAAVSIDACQLLTKQEVEAALGRTVGDAIPEATPPFFGCRFAAPSGFDGAAMTVGVYGSPPEALATFEMALKINSYQQVSGVGDRAYLSPINDITVLKGRYELSVDVTLSKGDERAAARRLAELAVARLPG
jgi:hypothetical protein